MKIIGSIGDDENVKVYAVGGYVRDQILNRPINEIDFVVVGDGPSLAEKAMNRLNGHGFVVYEKFGTASFLINSFKLEFVSARKESYRSDSRNPNVKRSDLTDDLTRRDFTINTLAMGLNKNEKGKIIDSFHGKRDIKSQIIRTPLDPAKTFSDDPLRIMRAIRFAAQLGFEIESETVEAIKKEKDRLKIVSQERITDEFMKILSSAKPSIGLELLQKTGVMALVFPEISILEGVEQRDDYHHKDVFEHTLKVVDNLAKVTNNLFLRFTGLVHDIGKPQVKKFVKNTGWIFHGHELVSVRLLKEVGRRFKLSKEMMRYSQKLTKLHMRPIQLIGEEVTDSAIRRLIVHAGDDLKDLITLCRADITSGNPKRVKKHLSNFNHVSKRMQEVEEKDKMKAFQSPVRGDEIMKICGITPGPLVGELKHAIEEAILEGVIPNEHDSAKNYLIKIRDQYIT